MSKLNYLGVWELIPEKSKSPLAPLPVKGQYEIKTQGHIITLHMTWKSHLKGHSESSFLSGSDNGNRSPLKPKKKGLPDAIQIQPINQNRLDCVFFYEGKLVASTQHQVSEDGKELTLAHESYSPNGQKYRSFQIYRRLKI